MPRSFVEKGESQQKLKSLFDLGNQMLHPFYAFSDDLFYITSRKKSFGTVNRQQELLGIFWLTYFNIQYVRFFGREKFNELPGVVHIGDGGVTIILDESADLVMPEVREEIAVKLGRQSFVDPEDILRKPQGRYVLTYQQLRSHK